MPLFRTVATRLGKTAVRRFGAQVTKEPQPFLSVIKGAALAGAVLGSFGLARGYQDKDMYFNDPSYLPR